MRLVAVAGNSCLTVRSLTVLLTICWSISGSEIFINFSITKEVSESCRKASF